MYSAARCSISSTSCGLLRRCWVSPSTRATFTWTSACGSGAGPSATAGFPTIQPKASPSATVTAFQLVMVPSFQGGEKHEARQAICRLGAPRLCCGGHYEDAGGVSSLPRDFLLKNQKASMIRATIKPILKTRKNNGSRKAAASFHSTTPTRPTAASCTTGFSISESGTRDVEQYATGGQKCRGWALK